jgi:hypothetical protein
MVLTIDQCRFHAKSVPVQIHEAAECELISKLATNATKKELFAKLAAHHRTLADQVERAMSESKQ